MRSYLGIGGLSSVWSADSLWPPGWSVTSDGCARDSAGAKKVGTTTAVTLSKANTGISQRPNRLL